MLSRDDVLQSFKRISMNIEYSWTSVPLLWMSVEKMNRTWTKRSELQVIDDSGLQFTAKGSEAILDTVINILTYMTGSWNASRLERYPIKTVQTCQTFRLWRHSSLWSLRSFHFRRGQGHKIKMVRVGTTYQPHFEKHLMRFMTTPGLWASVFVVGIE